MAYTTFEEVQGDFKDIAFTAASNVKDTEVTQFIAEADALIDSFLAMRYVVPISAETALTLVKMYSRNLVANRIKAILEVKQATNTDANQNVRSGLSTSDILKLLKQLKDGDTLLIGADLIQDSAGFFSNNYENGVQPVFHKDEKEW